MKLTANDLGYLRPYRNQLYLKGEVGVFVEGALGEQERKEKRQKLRRRFFITSLIVGLMASGFLGYRLYEELKTERAMSESNSMAEASMRIVEADPFIAYLWAEKAYNLFPGLPAARAVLRAYNSLYPQVASYSGTVARVSDDRRTFLIVDPEWGFTVNDLEGRTLFSKRLTSRQSQGVQFIASGTHVLCVDSAVTILDLSGRTIFTCDTANWLAYNNKGRFLGVTRDSLVFERDGRLEALPWQTRALVQAGFSGKSSYGVTTVGFLDSATVYLFGADSLRLVTLDATPRKTAASGNTHSMTFPQAGVVHGKLVCDTRSGTSVFDPVAQRWVDLRLEDGPMTWTHFFDDVVIVQVGSGQQDHPAFMEVYGTNGNFSEPMRLSGWFVQHFTSDGTTLATPSEQKTGETILYGRDGGTLLRTVGYPAAFDKQGFLTLSDSTVYRDAVTVWSTQGQPISKLALNRVSAIHTPPHHAIWLDHLGDTAVVGYFTDAVFNDRKVKEFRTVQSGLVTCYQTFKPDFDYYLRNMFVALAGGRSLVNRGEYGHVLTNRQALLEHIPCGGRGNAFGHAILPMGFVGGDYFITKGLMEANDTATAYTAWHFSLWRPGSYTKDSIVDEGERFWKRSISVSNGRRTSPFGDLFKINSSSIDRERALLVDQQVSIWDLISGQEIKNRWLEEAVDVLWSDQDTAVALVVGSDSIHIMDRRLKKGLLSETRDSSMLASETEDRYHAFWNMQKNLLRIVNLASVSIHLMRIDPAQLDARIDTKLGMYPDRSRISAQNDSTAYFILNYWTGGGIVQRFINGKASGTIETPGSSRLCYRNGVAYLRSQRITVKDGDYEIQQEHSDQVTYYRLDDTQGGLRLTKVPMRTVEPPEMQYNVLDDRIRWWGDELLQVDGNLLDVHIPQHVLATHRLVNEYEEFPMSPKAAIDLVRNKKVYGEFWKKYFSTPE